MTTTGISDPFQLLFAARGQADALQRGLQILEDTEGGWHRAMIREPAYAIAALNMIASIGMTLADLSQAISEVGDLGEDIKQLAIELKDVQRAIADRRAAVPS